MTPPPNTTTTTTTTTSTTTTDVGGNGATGGTTSVGGNTGGGGDAGGGGAGGDGGCGGGLPEDCDELVMVSGTDKCPGEMYAVALGNKDRYKLCLVGDTSGAAHDYTSKECGTDDHTSGPENVYLIDIKDSGSLVQTVKSLCGPLDPTLYARMNGSCEDVNSYYGCWNFFATHEEFKFDTPPDIYHTFIDGAAGSSGPYVMEVILSKPKCGDGVINNFNGTEECDDGNTDDNDGCSKDCKFELITLFDSCPGEPVLLLAGQTQVFQGNTGKYKDNFTAAPTGGCASAKPQKGGKDRVYEITAGASGTVKATVGYDTNGTTNICEKNGLVDPGCWDYVLYVTGPDACDDGMNGLGPQIACSSAALFAPEEVSFTVEKGKKYFVFIDGHADYVYGYGAYNLQLSLTAN